MIVSGYYLYKNLPAQFTFATNNDSPATDPRNPLYFFFKFYDGYSARNSHQRFYLIIFSS